MSQRIVRTVIHGTVTRQVKPLLEVSVLRMAPSDTDSVSSCVTCGKKTPHSEVVFLCQVITFCGYSSQRLVSDQRFSLGAPVLSTNI
jgi:hypothetical protein